MSLTADQRSCLLLLADGCLHSPAELGSGLGKRKEGAATTASSLVRRGLALRMPSPSGLVRYCISDGGRREARRRWAPGLGIDAAFEALAAERAALLSFNSDTRLSNGLLP